MAGSGTKDDPWQLTTPPGTSDYTMYRDDAADPPQHRLPGRIHEARPMTLARSTTCTPG